MKTVLILMAMVFSLMAAVAEESAMLLDYETDYKTAIAKAKKEHKMVLMVIVQDPCPYCDKLVRKTLDTPCVQRRMKNYVPLIVDKHGEFPKQFKPPFIPMSYIVDPNSEEVTFKIVGSVPVKDYIHDLETEIEFREVED
ncbi:MAG: thioredoxin family protein [Sulfurimonadaceae bacterium]